MFEGMTKFGSILFSNWVLFQNSGTSVETDAWMEFHYCFFPLRSNTSVGFKLVGAHTHTISTFKQKTNRSSSLFLSTVIKK